MDEPSGDWGRLGRYVLSARTAAGFSDLADLAAATGITDRTLGKLETGKRVGTKTLAAVARHVGWTPDSPQLVLAGGEPVPLEDRAAASDTLAVRREAADPGSPASVTPLLARRRAAEGFPPAGDGIEERMPAFADKVWTEVLAAQAAYGIHADLLTGAQVFGDGSPDAKTWDTYREVLDLPWRVRTVALTRAIAAVVAEQSAN